MLMQNFQAAADLGISEAQKEALIKTLVLLEMGKLQHVRGTEIRTLMYQPSFTGHFNMASWNEGHHCGTVACIGGTAELVGGLDPFELSEATVGNEPLDELFYPNRNNEANYSAITPVQAARALRSYLTTGDAKWTEAVSVTE